MPPVFALLVAALICLAGSASALAQLPVGIARRAAPVTRLVPPRSDAAADTDSQTKGDGAVDGAPLDGDANAEPEERPIVSSEDKAAGASDANQQDAPIASPENQPIAPSTARPRVTRPAVGAAPLRSFDIPSPGASDTATRRSVAPADDEFTGAAASSSTDHATSTGAARRAVRLDPVSLKEVQPGVSTLAQLDSKWGSPVNDRTKLGSGQRTYEFAPFKQVDVTLDHGKVTSIVAHLAEPLALQDATRQFVPRAADPVEVLDDRGQALGLAFPERGVAFGYAGDANDVTKLLFDPIEYESFLMRAERNQHLAPQQSLADVEFVLERHARHGPALALAAQIYFQAGQLTLATARIDRALESEPKNAAYRLTKAEILAESGDFTTSRQSCERVLQDARIAPELKARALCLLGDFLANGPDRDYKRAIEHHLAAVQTAQPLAESAHAATRRAAKRVLVCANLGVANDIAWGFWQQKEQVVPKWLVAAHQAAEDLIDREGADESLHLLVLRRALATSAGTEGKLDPVDWTKEAVKTARRLIDSSDDAWRRSRIEWELGLALYDALQADQARGYHDHALSNSSLVVRYLESALRQRQETPQGAYLLGRLYFRVGAIYAVELNDHRTAITWFQKAVPLLERPLPSTALADVGRLGESFVSIGISYWESGRRDEAMRVTQHGIALVMQGVKDRVIEEDALAVPYSNLAFMHRELGHARQADGYAEMASRLDDTRRE